MFETPSQAWHNYGPTEGFAPTPFGWLDWLLVIGIPLAIVVAPYVRALVHGIVNEWSYRRWLKEKGY